LNKLLGNIVFIVATIGICAALCTIGWLLSEFAQ